MEKERHTAQYEHGHTLKKHRKLYPLSIHVSPGCLWFEMIGDQISGLNQCIHVTEK